LLAAFIDRRRQIINYSARVGLQHVPKSDSQAVGERAAARRARWRDKFETIQRQTFDERDAPIDLVTEMRFLDALASREQFMTQLYDLWWSVVFLVALWVIGALSFSHIEGLPYGDGA
jgi:potassium channel subfamily K